MFVGICHARPMTIICVVLVFLSSVENVVVTRPGQCALLQIKKEPDDLDNVECIRLLNVSRAV